MMKGKKERERKKERKKDDHNTSDRHVNLRELISIMVPHSPMLIDLPVVTRRGSDIFTR
jgi:hypothetical protein